MRAPDWVTAPGKTMMKLVPSEPIASCTECEAPAPTATMVMTQATPMMMPSMVRLERIGLRTIALRPTLAMLPSRMMTSLMCPPPPLPCGE